MYNFIKDEVSDKKIEPKKLDFKLSSTESNDQNYLLSCVRVHCAIYNFCMKIICKFYQ